MPEDNIYSVNKNNPLKVTIADLYPELSPEEQAQAEDVLKRYVALVWRIYQRVHREKEEKFDENHFKR